MVWSDSWKETEILDYKTCSPVAETPLDLFPEILLHTAPDIVVFYQSPEPAVETASVHGCKQTVEKKQFVKY